MGKTIPKVKPNFVPKTKTPQAHVPRLASTAFKDYYQQQLSQKRGNSKASAEATAEAEEKIESAAAWIAQKTTRQIQQLYKIKTKDVLSKITDQGNYTRTSAVHGGFGSTTRADSSGPVHPEARGGSSGPVHPAARGGSSGPVHPAARGGSSGPVHPAARGGNPGPVRPAVRGGNPGPVHPAARGGNPGPTHPAARGGNPGPVHPAARSGSPDPVRSAARSGSPGPVHPAAKSSSPDFARNHSKPMNTTQRATAKGRGATIPEKRKLRSTVIKPSKMQQIQAQRVKAHAARKRQLRTARFAAKKAAKVAKYTLKAAKALVKLIAAQIKAAASVILSIGGPVLLVLVLVLAVGIVGYMIASPFGVFFSGGNDSADAIPIAVIVNALNREVNQQIQALQDSGDYIDITIHGNTADWADVLAIFAVHTSMGADPLDVVNIDDERAELLKAIYWDMNFISHEVEEITRIVGDDIIIEYELHIYIESKTADLMQVAYQFDQQQVEALAEMMLYRQLLLALAGDLSTFTASAQEIIDALPDELSPERREVVITALRLLDKVSYFWGGKSDALGWDSRWGTLKKVTSAGSPSTGTYRPFGLDCSGYVCWVFVNAKDDKAAYWQIGDGAGNQHRKCTDIALEDAQPGDLAFYSDNSHCGIVVGRDNAGNLLIAHCASGRNNVIVTTFTGGGFTAVARPAIYDSWE